MDAVLDDLFGPVDTGGPGWLDVLLVASGVALLVLGHPVLGAVLLVLGLALPVRSVSAARRVRGGQPLATGHPATAALVAAYDDLLAAAANAADWLRDEAVEAGHRALLECASLLAGHVPVTDEETAYVARRIDAIRLAAAALSSGAVRPDRVAAVRAREEIDAMTGTTSVDDLRAVARRVTT